MDVAKPPTVTADALSAPFDAVLLSCKAYDLEDAIASFAPAVGPETLVLPLLNGMAHIDALDARFGAARVLGGRAIISSTLDGEGRIVHFGPMHSVTFGARSVAQKAKADQLAALLAGAGFDASQSADIMQDMWEKWVFIATVAGITSLMRSTVGDIVAAGASDLTLALLDEASAVAAKAGHEPSSEATQRTRTLLTAAGSPMTASMFRDILNGGRVEAGQIIGDLIRRAGAEIPTPVLRTVFAHLKTYEARRARESAGR